MIPFLPWRHSLEGTALLFAFVAVFGSFAMPDVFRTKSARIVLVTLAFAFLVAHLVWQLAPTYELSCWGAAFTLYGLIVGCFLAASLPVAALLRAMGKRILTKPVPKRDARTTDVRATKAAEESMTRRQALNVITAAAPAVALAASTKGFVGGVTAPEIPRLVFRIPKLAAELRGLTILQLSDLHLGVARHAKDFDAFVDRLGERGVRPDLVLFTGDVADDLAQIRPAFDAARRLKPRLGVHSVLGNHEHFHGFAVARDCYERARANLLLDRGIPLRVGGATLWLAGLNDPFSSGEDFATHLRRATEKAMRDCPSHATSILMSHRPEGFVHAIGSNVDLTLSGHTHGGQIGFEGKSAFEPLFPDGYLWGRYQRGSSQLYTTSGWGHWFPFRLGCPAEAPLIVLEDGDESAPA